MQIPAKNPQDSVKKFSIQGEGKMFGNLIGLLVLFLIAVFFGWLTWRARHAKSVVVKWVGVVFGALLTLLFLLVALVTTRGVFEIYRTRGTPVQEIKVQATPEQIARGQHLADVLCAGCHTTNNQIELD